MTVSVWTSICGCLCLLYLCFQFCEPKRLVKRQEVDNPFPAVSTTRAADDNPAQTTVQTFDQFLEEMFKDLGIDMNENDTETLGNSQSDVNATQEDLWKTSTPNEATLYPNEENISSIPPEDLDSITTTTGARNTDLFTNPVTTTTWITETTNSATGTSLNNENCRVNPTLSDFCILPEELINFLGPSATLHDLSDYLVSMDIVHMLTEKCAAGSWCLDSMDAFHHLEEKIAFWSNSSDFMNLCWQPIDGCLRSVVDYFTGCDVYQMYDLIAETKKLLCQMKEEPLASRDCVEQTLKALHVSMADFHREDVLESEDNMELCTTRKALMTANYLCARGVCGKYGDLLYHLQMVELLTAVVAAIVFKPWIWFVDDVTTLQDMCIYDDAKCTTRKEVEEDQMEENKEKASQSAGGVSDDIVWGSEAPDIITENTEITDISNPEEMGNDESAYTLWVTEEIDVSTVLIVAAISVAALGFLFLVGLVWCLRRRRSRHRVREGVEYMEILPDMDD